MTAANCCIAKIGWALAVAAVLSSCTGPHDEQFQRARAACVQVGLPSDSPLVGDCAARMQAALVSKRE